MASSGLWDWYVLAEMKGELSLADTWLVLHSTCGRTRVIGLISALFGPSGLRAHSRVS